MHRCLTWRRCFSAALRFLAALGVLGLAGRGRADEFPYTATVSSADVFVRSGPGRNYYPTDKLAVGDKVEVYRHDPGGWCAIRPPRHSFSWVAARQLDPVSDGLALVNGDRVVARVGSTLSNVRDVIQVRLDRGEKVEVLESAQASGGHWCKIAPPSGEFRWVFSKFLDREPAADDKPLEHSHHATVNDRPNATFSDADAGGGKPAIRLAAATDADHSVEHSAGPELPPNATDRAAHAPVRPYGSPASFQKELNDIDLEISAMLVKDPGGWSFTDLHARAEGAFKLAQTAPERGRARTLLNKIVRLEEIQQRSGQIAIVPADSLRASRGPVDGQTIGTVPQMGGFDGIGRLEPVVSRKTGAPQYALLDAKGAIACFVTPAPGVNLQAYVNKQVGVNGSRSYVTELKKQHVDVQRVTLLNSVTPSDVIRR